MEKGSTLSKTGKSHNCVIFQLMTLHQCNRLPWTMQAGLVNSRRVM